MITNGIWKVPTAEKGLDRVMDRALEDFFGPYMLGRGVRSATEEYVPALDIWELEEGYGISIDVPGFTMDRLDVTVHGNELTITGLKARSVGSGSGEEKSESSAVTSSETSTEDRQYRHRERADCTFRRQISLPEAVNPDAVTAELANGVLTINLPKAEQARVKRIQVKTHQ